ncbi:MAG: hypothetical protein EBU90_28170 [Proteobacteria bacterium]|nr:hypothetical protein [Pseudomonadota bacterium]
MTDSTAAPAPSLSIVSNPTVPVKRTISVNNIGDATNTNDLFGVQALITGAVNSAIGYSADVSDATGGNIGVNIINSSTQSGSTQWGSRTNVGGIGPDIKYGHYTLLNNGGKDNYGNYNEVFDGTSSNTAYYGNVSGITNSYVLQGTNSSATPLTITQQYGVSLTVNGAGGLGTTKYGGYFDVSGMAKGNFGISTKAQDAIFKNCGVEAYASGFYGNNFGVYASNDTSVSGGGDTQYGGYFENYGFGDDTSTIKYGVFTTASNAALENYGIWTQSTDGIKNYSLYANSGRWTTRHDPNLELGVSDPEGYGDIVYFGGSGSSFNAGDVVYLDSNGDWLQADATTATTSTSMLAIALGSVPSDGMLVRGYVFSSGFGFTIGVPLYLRTAAGSITEVAPGATGNVVRIVGYATGDFGSGNKIYFNPDNTWVEI